MEISKTNLALTLLLTIVLTFGATMVTINTFNYFGTHKDPEVSANVFVFVEKANAKYTVGSGNVITNIGENYTRDALSTDTDLNQTRSISIGNATAGVALTKLTTEWNRTDGTVTDWVNGTDQAYNTTFTWNFNTTVRLDCAGLHWNPIDQSDNNMFACADFTATTFNSGDNCTITWSITVDAN